MVKALITGITGQTGSYMAEKLLEEGMKVYGFHRRNSQNVFNNLKKCLQHPNFKLVEGDLSDFASVSGVINDLKPDYVFNYAAQSHVHTSFEQPVNTFYINTLGVLNLLESIRKFSPKTKMLQASTSEQFGNNYDIFAENVLGKKLQRETTPFNPRSPYAVSKVAAHQLCYTYRESYNIYVVCSICFNHESPRRGENFVTRKITKWIAENIDKIRNGEIPKLKLGNLDSFRDWGHAKDYCNAMRLMIEIDKPDDYIICTGETHSIRQFLDIAFKYVNIENWDKYVEIDPAYFRPAEVDYLRGDNSKIKKLGWESQYTLEKLIKEMIESDYNAK